MSRSRFLPVRNGRAVLRSALPELSFESFRQEILASVGAGARVAALFGHVDAGWRAVALYAVIADSARAHLLVGKTTLDSDRFASLTPACPQVHLFEREIAEQFAVQPEHHPWLKPVRFHPADRSGTAAAAPTIGVTDYFRVAGAQVHEVAVGPVHAGVIEPGHFRFQCHGEDVFHLEISLGYQHRGVERALAGGPNKRTIHLIETAAGDTSVGHAIAYCLAVEALGSCQVPARAEVFRGIALELERLANHTGDLGALANDVAYLPTAAFCGRLRGEFLNLSATLCGSRLGRGLIRPGGVGFDLTGEQLAPFRERLDAALVDVAGAAELLFNSASVQARFEQTGVVSPEVCRALGLVGPAARACGLDRDVRQDFPWGIFRFAQIPVSTWTSGDVFARAYVRWLEIQRSVEFLRAQLAGVPQGPLRAPLGPLHANHLAIALVEGWRGEICHVALTDENGRFARYQIVDPSFHNWIGLALALRGGQISDFPLCNKSFNLSYCGTDL